MNPIHTLTFYFYQLKFSLKSRDSSDGIATSYRLEERGSIPCGGKKFHLLHSAQVGSEAYLASYLVSTRGFLLGSKAAGA
jgi:hypothetical protein